MKKKAEAASGKKAPSAKEPSAKKLAKKEERSAARRVY